jgi:hypothetical protein
VAPVIYGILGLELAAVIGFAATYNALDFRIYMWGGHAVTHDTRLYLALAYGHWFTYSPFAAGGQLLPDRRAGLPGLSGRTRLPGLSPGRPGPPG